MVFQQHTLFPWKTLLDNVAFGPRMRGISKAEARSIARQVIAMVGLERYEEYYPGALSGGMQHRGEIARALANYPAVLLMDEPFGALDAQTRINLQEGLLDVWARTSVTILFVTHDVDEAILLGDRVVVFPANRKTGLIDLKNPLKRPRSREVMLDRAFGELRKICLEMLKE